ncbi:MAG TPA: polymer-forming cytoskeletal protein [Ktedonobacterales bacterium]
MSVSPSPATPNPTNPNAASASAGSGLSLRRRPTGRIVAFGVTLVSLSGLLVWATLSISTLGRVMPFALAQGTDLTWFNWSAPTTSARATGMSRHDVSASALACDSSGLSSFGSNVTIGAPQDVCGDVLVVGANATVQGELRGSLQVIGGNATISGVVTGAVYVVGGNLAVLSGARIFGAAHVVGGSLVVAPGASVNSAWNDLQTPHDFTRPPGLNVSIDIGSLWLSLLFWLSAALGVTFFAPEMVGRVRYTVAHHAVLSGLTGAAVGVIGGILAIALVFTCVGIPLSILIAIFAWVAWVVGTVGLGAWIGALLFGGPGGARQTSLMASSLLGVTILCILKALPVAGTIIGLISGAVALGASVLTLLSARRTTVVKRA